jgi:Asp-tRNA(Asn)/Glu-tRNA(Gln) amidotransferase C subunit|tara:strand:+ start:362 stop:565 length:204 start_codon:yes stop_codon:yes gene_type:complete
MKEKDKIEEKDILEDIDKIIDYIDNLSNLDIENTDLDKFEKEINSLGNEFNEKYKKYLPKDNLDSKK